MAAARKHIPTLDLRTRAQWRRWLARHHASSSEIWLVFHKQHTGETCIDYEAAVEEALCFGWIDSLVRRLDDARYARKFTPRKPRSAWSALNRRRYASLEQRRMLHDAGRAKSPGAKAAKAPARRAWPLVPYIEQALRRSARAWVTFEQLAPSYKRAYVGWIDSAKRAETRERRLREAVRLLERGEKLGLK